MSRRRLVQRQRARHDESRKRQAAARLAAETARRVLAADGIVAFLSSYYNGSDMIGFEVLP